MADVAVQPPTQEEVIARLDPDRDYGKRGYAGTKAAVREGVLALTEAKDYDIPVIRQVSNGLAVKGTARVNRNPSGSSAAGQRLTKRLVDFMEEDDGEQMVFDVVYETLNLNSDAKYEIPWKSRVDMVVFITERLAGRTADARPPVEDALIKELLSRMQAGTLNEEREIPLLTEYTTNEVEFPE